MGQGQRSFQDDLKKSKQAKIQNSQKTSARTPFENMIFSMVYEPLLRLKQLLGQIIEF